MKRTAKIMTAAALLGGIVASGERAEAGGFWLPARGARSLAMGGATVAGAVDGSAMWDNPANLAAFDGSRLTVDLGLIQRGTSFQREGSSIETNNSAAPQVDPSVFFTTDLGTKNFTFGVGVWAPYLSPTTFDENADTRYQLVSSTGSIMLYQGLGVAWQPSKYFRIGAVLENMTVKVRFIKMASAYTGFIAQPESKDWDMLVKMEGTKAVNISGAFGLWLKLGKLPIEIGASTQLPIDLNFDGTMEARLPSSVFFDNAKANGNSAKFDMSMPWITRVGLRVAQEKWDVEAAYKYERWRTIQNLAILPDIVVTGLPAMEEQRIHPINVPKYFRDAHSFHLGGSFRIGEKVRMRAGYFFERGAVPPQTLSLENADMNKHGFSLGASVAVGSWEIDMAYAHIAMQTTTVQDSLVTQQNPVNEGGASTVGNGTFTGSYNIFGVGFSKKF
ncbi:MAG: outer membrane protein transport protein [Deltaproteobacteria bacterium]|nr:outer membrane protein transport protein [Deltaproteobacteria bacterium]